MHQGWLRPSRASWKGGMEAFILTHDWVVGVPLPWVALACLFEATSGHRIGGDVQATLLSKEQSARE
eukprot:10572562-Alexandrium_andersonii.AAC.1